MLQKLIHRFLEPRHYWRTVSFNELSELYTTQFLRSLSINLVGIFVPVYLYNIGYSITQIALFFLVWFSARPLLSYPTAKLIGEIGPKHAMVFSVAIQIAYLSLILSIESMNWPLWMVAIVGSFYYGLYRMAFDIDFSKVKHSEHGGKEVGILQIFERVGGVLGPVIGGLVAGIFDPRYAIALAIVVLAASLIPLFATAEPVKRHQVVVIKGFPIRRYLRNIAISGAYQIQEVSSMIIWPLFLGAFVLINNTYETLGLLASLSTIVAIASSYAIGKIVDHSKGRELLNAGAIANSITLLIKPFITTASGAFMVNFAREPFAAMYRIPFMKGRYDEADSATGYRIVYFMNIEIAIAFANIFLWGTIVILSVLWSDKIALQFAFLIGAAMSLLLTKQNFRALR